MNSTATTTNDLEKDFQEQLQIDVGLANATDLTAASSFATSVSNRAQNDGDISDSWKTFYNIVGKSPPKATRDVEYPVAVDKANDLLRRSSVEDLSNKSFDNLDNDQQAIMMLMVTKKMDEAFKGNPDKCANLLVGALDPETQEYKSMMSFVRKGGDRPCYAPSIVMKRFVATRNAFVGGFKSGITIFDARESMKPYLYDIQRVCSYICTFNVCSALLYYFSYDIESDSATKTNTNISQYIRDEIDGLKIANLTLTTQKGAYLFEVLTGLMKSFGEDGKCYDIHKIQLLATYPETDIYDTLRFLIKTGRPFALIIELFPGLNNMENETFTGNLSDYYENGERPGPEARSYHAVVCIGIKPRGRMTPPMLLLQDSCDDRPAFSIGLDLLMDMGIDKLQLCTLPANWKPNRGMCYTVTKESSVSFAGSPMSFDKNDKPFIVPSEKPKTVQRDMSRYLHNSPPSVASVFYN
eukprot:CAMPEP_0116141758 /NCGR_PEP_ID=MMETSP0329-20121206/14548_1 /TAXON_ID=697910 /ORGANISM="Pseudo-nitzschia arenysensis, Strain B593" /LENGTH=467 /DNA_ID=CAMNT_0003636953 /DNA_START=103 /DNA_END=1506 /DNA_ORIENTATION=-